MQRIFLSVPTVLDMKGFGKGCWYPRHTGNKDNYIDIQTSGSKSQIKSSKVKTKKCGQMASKHRF